MNQRQRVIQFAKSDFAAAFQFAGAIESVRDRIQAFGYVARYAPAEQIPRVIAAVDAIVRTSSDFYGDLTGLAFPLRSFARNRQREATLSGEISDQPAVAVVD